MHTPGQNRLDIWARAQQTLEVGTLRMLKIDLILILCIIIKLGNLLHDARYVTGSIYLSHIMSSYYHKVFSKC